MQLLCNWHFEVLVDHKVIEKMWSEVRQKHQQQTKDSVIKT